MASVCPGRDVAFCSELSPTILEDSGDVFVTSDSSTGVKTTLPMPAEPMTTLKMAIGSQLIRSAELSGYERD